MNNKGFIATSVLYSFFVVFLMLSLFILNTYENHRVLIENLNSNILNTLNDEISNKYVLIKNHVSNGDFEENTALSGLSNSERNNTNSATGTYSLMMHKTPTTANSAFSINASWLENDNKSHKFYFAYRVFRKGIVNGTSEISLNFGSTKYKFTSLSLNMTDMNDWANTSNWSIQSQIINNVIVNNQTAKVTFSISNQTSEYQTFIDQVMLIDITNFKLDGSTISDAQIKEYFDLNVPFFTQSYAIPRK